jgi:hypothetical protein
VEGPREDLTRPAAAAEVYYLVVNPVRPAAVERLEPLTASPFRGRPRVVRLRCDFGAVGYLPVFEMAQASWSGQLSSSVVCGRNRANARAKAASRSVFVGGSAIGLIVSCKTARARSSHSSSCSSLNVCPARSSAHSHQSARIRSRCSSAMDHCKPRH